MNFIEFEGLPSARRMMGFVFLGWVLFNHFVRVTAPDSAYYQPSVSGGMHFSQNASMRSLNDFRLRMGDLMKSGATYCPESVYAGCSLAVGGVTGVLGLSDF